MAKLLKTVYKTFEGARKRAAFENAMAPGEFARGDKAKLYHYTVVPFESIGLGFKATTTYRVAREVVKPVDDTPPGLLPDGTLNIDAAGIMDHPIK
jgi:hypothetical protein